MPRYSLALRSTRTITPDGERPATVLISGERIAHVTSYDAEVDADEIVDFGTDALLPGLVDTHVHVNELGRDCEGFATATRAAAAGGITTIVDMPNGGIPPTVSVETLAVKRRAAEGQCFVDVAFWGGAVAGNQPQLLPLHEAGVVGFKCYLVPQSPDFPYLPPDQLWSALRELKTVDALMIVHAEDADVVAAAPTAKGSRFADFLAASPDSAEIVAITRLVEACRITGARVHIVHLSAAAALPVIRGAKRDGLRLTVETCPHYLTFAAEEIPDGATDYKCEPPVRTATNREQLWAAMAEGLVDCVVSDHAPCTSEQKQLDSGDFATAMPGISSLQLGLSAVWTEASKRGHSLADVVRWMSSGPAALVGLRSKGAIAEGYDADLVRFAPDETFTVEPTRLHHRVPLTPYAGRTLVGTVRTTWLRGTPTSDTPGGRLLTRDT